MADWSRLTSTSTHLRTTSRCVGGGGGDGSFILSPSPCQLAVSLCGSLHRPTVSFGWASVVVADFPHTVHPTPVCNYVATL